MSDNQGENRVQQMGVYPPVVSQLKLISKVQQIIVDPITTSISVINAGPQGPPGSGGGATNSYFHTQVAETSSWLINHNLGFRPNITVQEAVTGRMIMCSEIHHSTSQVELQFNTPRAGTARLS